jgi:hypothetical protein
METQVIDGFIHIAQMGNSQVIDGFIHIAQMGNWKEILDDQLDKLVRSGLYEKTSTIYVTVLGDEPIRDDPKFDVVRYSDLTMYEFPTLKRIQESEADYVWYIHSKGVSHPTAEHLTDWRNYMEYFVIERHEDCIRELDDHDCVGVELKYIPSPHYSGNFWWARGDYVRGLDIGELLADKGFIQRINKDWGCTLCERHKAEHWIATGNPRFACLFSSGEDGGQLYFNPLPRERYEGVEYRGEFLDADERQMMSEQLHKRGDEAYHAGDLKTAKELWTEGVALGNEQCKNNLEWAKTWKNESGEGHA